ncbi:MAG: 50S ribosomal protein L11 methyltransferase [Candidatus Rokubacteria bacterium]|nr:50S ribosomal protein L11 methyltransferase [Candidatus Rokubacteria bacterium]
MPPAGYWELRLTAPEDSAESLTNFLWELGALGVIEEDAGLLRAFFPDSVDASERERRLREYARSLARLGFAPASEPHVQPLADGNWAEAWREHFRPVPAGRGLIVAPPWEVPPPGERLVILIDPGRAFGTGHHGSTAGCLAALEDALERARPTSALDIGTGSGILAIAAARLGVARVVAIDEDPDAVAAAAANAALNGVADRIACAPGHAARLDVAPAPLVLANLLAAAHRHLAGAYRRYVAPAGTLVLGGILEPEADAVRAALAAHGFSAGRVHRVDGWATLTLTAPHATLRAPR